MTDPPETNPATDPTATATPAVPPEIDTPEIEPDARFTFANERTFLAWNRTALALIATGVAATQLLPNFDLEFGRRILGLPLIALGALLAITSYRFWQRNEQALRRQQPLPRSPMPLVLSVGIGIVALIAVLLGAFEN